MPANFSIGRMPFAILPISHEVGTLRQHTHGNAENFAELAVPGKAVNIKEHGSGGV